MRRFFFIPVLAALSLAALIWGWQPATAAEQMNAEQVKEIERIIRNYLVENPEVLLEAMRTLEERQKQKAAEHLRQQLSRHRRQLDNDPDSFVIGNPKGDLTLVEFFDYRCGYCRSVHPVVNQIVKKDPKVRVVLKEFPILGPDSVFASRAAIAVLKQQRQKYLPFHNAMMQAKGPLGEIVITQLAADVGIDVDRMRKDMQDPAVDRVIQSNMTLAKALGIEATPTFIIGDALVPGAIGEREFAVMIDQARAKCMTC